MQAHRPRRQDTFDLRDRIHPDDIKQAQQQYGQGETEQSVMEDSSDAEGEEIGQDPVETLYGAERDHDLDENEDDTIGEYMSDTSSSLSIPNESIDFDLVYSLTNFAATVEGQASVVKGDSLFLMDDSNSYWWLVRVLKTQEVGYIPAENIETPFERLARLNRHRNVDLASATQAEMENENPAASKTSRNRSRVQISAPEGESTSNGSKRGVVFHRQSSIFRYPPAVWNEEEEEGEVEWDEDDIEIEESPVKDGSTPAEEEGDANVIVENDTKPTGETANGQKQQQEDVEMEWSSEQRGPSLPAVLRPSPLAAGQVQQPQVPIEQQVQQEGPRQEQQQLQQPQQSQQPPQQQPQLRSQTSRERLIAQQGAEVVLQEGLQTPVRDPAQETETKRLNITPSIARDEPKDDGQTRQQQAGPGPLLPSIIIEKHQKQVEEERKRARDEIEAAEEAARKRAAKGRDIGLGPAPVQNQQRKELARTASEETRSSVASTPSGSAKLRKERGDKDRDKDKEAEDSERDSNKEKKKKGVFAGLFGRKKDKDKGSKTSIENIAAAAADGRTRGSEESSATVSSSAHSHGQSSYTTNPPETVRNVISPSPGVRSLQQRVPTPAQQPPLQVQVPPVQAQVLPLQPQGSPVQQPQATVQVSQHASSLRERDQQQQALYSEYLKRSPSSPPEQPSYATQAASLVMPTHGSGSLTSSPSSTGIGLGLAPVNASYRTASGRPGSLILSPAGVDGQSAVPELSVIRVFAGDNLQTDATFKTVLLNTSTTAAELVRQSMQRFRLAAGEDAADYYLTVKQVEGTSLKLAPDMKPLGVFEQLVEEAEQMPMKIKRSSMGSISSVASNLSAHPAIRKLPMNDFTDDSAVKFYLNRLSEESDTSNQDGESSLATAGKTGSDSDGSLRDRSLAASNSDMSSASPDRFSSPSVRFPAQLVIYPEELPDNMVFDPHTEAIVFKETLRERSESSATINPSVPQNMRKKYFNFPKNITVAEVIELGLERFGILEGVVDGGDEVEDKLTKRRSTSRVRYILTVQVDGQERELQPSTKVIDAFRRPPAYRRSSELKRRSVDSAQLLQGSADDIQNDDPLFILRRAVTYRSTSKGHHRLSAPLDELALSQLHREISASDHSPTTNDSKGRQLSRQEIIAAQRAASRANQKALLSAQANSQRGIDVMLPDKAMLRSQRTDTDSKMRYSYVQPDGETYDVSDIVEEELKTSNTMQSLPASGSESSTNDLLSGVMKGGQSSALINRVLNKIKNGPVSQSTSTSTFRSASPSMYSDDDRSDGSGSRAATPTGVASHRSITPTTNKDVAVSRSRSVTPTAGTSSDTQTHRQYQPSIESVLSDVSDYRTAASGTPLPTAPSRAAMSPSPFQTKRPRIPKDEFGLTEMLAVIQTKAMLGREPRPPSPDEVEKLFFGTPIDPETVHPQIRDVYASTFKKMKEIDTELDTLLQKALSFY